jgi:hypothetical protein
MRLWERRDPILFRDQKQDAWSSPKALEPAPSFPTCLPDLAREWGQKNKGRKTGPLSPGAAREDIILAYKVQRPHPHSKTLTRDSGTPEGQPLVN